MPNSACSFGAHRASLALCYVGNDQHVGTVVVELEIVANVLTQDRRRKRAEALTIFDLKIQIFCIAGSRGSPRIERLPSARGPNSMRPWNQPTAFPFASAEAVPWISSGIIDDSEAGASRGETLVHIPLWSNDGPR